MPTRSVGTRQQLRRTAIVDRALTVADTHGLAAVTIRRLAQDFDVTPMALYWHFQSKDELLAAMGDQLIADVGVPDDPADPWAARLRTIVAGLVSALRQHPNAAGLAASRIMASEQGLELTERTLSLLRTAGFSVAQAADLARQALHTAIMLVSGEPGREPGVEPGDREQVLRAKRAALAGLSATRYPNVVAAADDLLACDDEKLYYDSGVELFVAGVQTMSSSASPSTGE